MTGSVDLAFDACDSSFMRDGLQRAHTRVELCSCAFTMKRMSLVRGMVGVFTERMRDKNPAGAESMIDVTAATASFTAGKPQDLFQHHHLLSF